jgi:autotransporter-associated beta strand protein
MKFHNETAPKTRDSKAMRREALLYGALLAPAILLAVHGGQAQAGQLPLSAFQTYNPANAAGIQAGPLSLYSVPVDSIQPTQMNEGLTEVGKKTAAFDLLAPSQLQANLLTDIEPVVIGPGGQLYLTDGHHTFTALENSTYGASNPTVYVNVIANYSSLTTAQFYALMQADNFLLPINDGVPETVNTATGAPIPSSLTGLTSDPYRGLEYSILKNKSSVLFPATGASTPGLDKMTGFYSDFLEADAYRGANLGLGLPYLSPGDISKATTWNLTANSTTTLPNIAGTVTAAQLPGFILSQSIVNSGGISNATLAGGAMDGNGAFTGITSINAGTAAQPITIGTPNTGFVMQLGADAGNTVTLNGTNTYTGGTSILAGTLIVQSDASLGAAPTGAAIDLANVKTSVQAANGIVFNSLTEGNGTLTLGTNTTAGTFTTNRPIAVGGEAATINLNDNLVTLGGSIYSLGVSGVGIGNATGFSDLTIDDLSSADAGKLILSQASPDFYGNLIIGNVGAPTVEVMSDAALGATTGSPYQIGEIELNSGTLQAGASFSAPERNLFLQSGSQIDVNGFNTTWGSITDVQRTLQILNSSTTTPGSITFSNLAISATASLQLTGGTAGETVTLTNGVTRTGADTLIVMPTSPSSLGTTEKLFSGTAAASLVNGMAPAWMVTNNGVAKFAGPYDFLTYGPNGYVKATYTNTATLNSSTASQVVALSGNTTLTGAASVYALNTESKTLALGANTLTIGDGVNPAGLILGTGNITASGGGTLAFGASEGMIWLGGSNSTISAAITGTGGLTFAGSGGVTISAPATVSGAITIDSGTVTLSGVNVFATNVGGILLDDVKSKPAASTLVIAANNTLTALNTVGNNSTVTINSGVALTLGDTTNNLSSTISAAITEKGSTAVAGALTLNGSGLFDLSGMKSGKLSLVSGSTIVVDNSADLRVAANIFSNAGIGVVLNGTSQLQFAQNGGGVFANTVSGTGSLHLIGGTLQLTGTSNTYTGGTIVETGSTLDLTTANVSSGNANITDAGGLIVFDQATNGTYSGVISDGAEMGTGPLLSGSLDKDDSSGANSGNLTLTSVQTYTGPTTVEAGTLTLAAKDTVAASSGVDLGRVGGGSTAILALGADNTLQALTSEAGDTTSVTLGSYQLTLNTSATTYATFGGVISGTGALLKTGAGTEVLSGANVYSGGTTIQSGALIVAGSLNLAGALTNNSVLGLQSGTANHTLTVGAYTGGTGSQLELGVNFKAGTADNLVVASATGTSKIVVVNTAPNAPVPYNPTGIVVVSSTAPMSPTAFTLPGGPVQMGFFQYDLAYTPDPHFLLVATPTADAYRVAAVPTAAQSIWQDTAGVQIDRQADLRDLMIAGGASGAAEAGVWGRALGGWTDRTQSSTYSVLGNSYAYQTGYNQNTGGIFFGIDGGSRGLIKADDTLLVGFSGGYVNSTQSFKGSSTAANYQGASVGISATYLDKNLFVDALAKADLLKLDYADPALANVGASQEDGGVVNLGMVVDAGYRLNLGPGYVDPLATLSYVSTRVGGLSLAGEQVGFGDNSLMKARLGLRGGATVFENKAIVVQSSVTASYWQRLSGGSSATIDSGSERATVHRLGPERARLRRRRPGRGRISKDGDWSGFFKGDYQFANGFTSGTIKGGFRYSF